MAIGLCTLLLNLAAIILFVRQERAREIKRLSEKIETMNRLIEATSIEPLWDVDRGKIRMNLRAFYNDEEIVSIHLRETTGAIEETLADKLTERGGGRIARKLLVKRGQDILGEVDVIYSTGILERKLRDIEHEMGWFALASLVFVSSVTYLIAVIVLKPVDHIAEGLHRLDQGNYQYVLKLNTQDEFKNIEEDFNKMAATIQREIQSRIQKEQALIQRENEILKLNAQLEKRVHERTAQLERANQELEAFSYSVSHDLRSPLRAMEGLSHVLLEDYGPTLNAEAQDYLQRIQGAAERMGYLIDDMLRLSRISRTALRRERVDLSALARSVLEGLQASDSKRTVEVCIAENLHADVDLNLMRIALENMLGNAWKFTARTAHARIEFGRALESTGSNPGAPFFIRDNGVGFDMAYVDKLFGVFQRLHRAEEFPGTGIGLSIVARIVHLHGGDIWAESGVDQGATFFFTLSPSRGGGGEGVTTDQAGQEC